jgi:hypothetical protein
LQNCNQSSADPDLISINADKPFRLRPRRKLSFSKAKENAEPFNRKEEALEKGCFGEQKIQKNRKNFEEDTFLASDRYSLEMSKNDEEE